MERFGLNLLMELGPLYHHAAVMLILFDMAWFGRCWPQLHLGWLSILDFSVGIKYDAPFGLPNYPRSKCVPIVGQPSQPSRTSHPAQIRMNPLLLALQAILILSAVAHSRAELPHQTHAPHEMDLWVREGDTATILCDVPIAMKPTGHGATTRHLEKFVKYTTGERSICIRMSIFQYYWSPTLQL